MMEELVAMFSFAPSEIKAMSIRERVNWLNRGRDRREDLRRLEARLAQERQLRQARS